MTPVSTRPLCLRRKFHRAKNRAHHPDTRDTRIQPLSDNPRDVSVSPPVSTTTRIPHAFAVPDHPHTRRRRRPRPQTWETGRAWLGVGSSRLPRCLTRRRSTFPTRPRARGSAPRDVTARSVTEVSGVAPARGLGPGRVTAILGVLGRPGSSRRPRTSWASSWPSAVPKAACGASCARRRRADRAQTRRPPALRGNAVGGRHRTEHQKVGLDRLGRFR
jgi:hypothetical protein